MVQLVSAPEEGKLMEVVLVTDTNRHNCLRRESKEPCPARVDLLLAWEGERSLRNKPSLVPLGRGYAILSSPR